MAVNHLVVRFRNLNLAVADDVPLEVAELDLWSGSCLQITGVNGGGKSRLLRVLAGLERPVAGEIQTDGPATSWDRARNWLRHTCVYLHQSPYMFDDSVKANVAYGLRRRGINRAAANLRASEALEWAGLGQLGRRHARTLSPGEIQRVAIVRARVLHPRLLMLDDPMTGLDGEATEQMRFLLRRLQAEGIGIIIAASQSRPLQAVAERTLLIDHGALKPIALMENDKRRPQRPGSNRGERMR